MKTISVLLFFSALIFAATGVAIGYVYDTNLTVSWTPSTTYGVDIYRYDENESNITHVATVPWDTSLYTIPGLTQRTTYTIIVQENDENATAQVTTTATWGKLMAECATGKQEQPSKAQLASISSFSCSYSGEQNILALCDLTGTQKIDMRGNWIRQSIPSCIGELTQLHDLDMSGNMMSGAIPSEITTLPLVKLDLSNNQFTRLPVGIENMTSLEELHVSFNRLTQKLPPELGDMWWLERLYLQGNRLFGEIPEELGNMSSLQKLRLNENHLRGTIPYSFIDLNLTQPNGLGLHENCRIELPIDTILERVVNGTFDADTNWTKESGWTIGSGVAMSSGDGDVAGYLSQPGVFDSETEYQISLDVLAQGEGVTLEWRDENGTAHPFSYMFLTGTYSANTTIGTDSDSAIYIKCKGCTIDNVSVIDPTLDVNETEAVLSWMDSKASLYRGYTGMQQTGGKCWTPAIVPIMWYLLDDSNTTDENLTE